MRNSVTTGDSVRQYSYIKSQKDALFHKLIFVKSSTCFEHIYCPSSLYTQQMLFVMLVMLSVC